MAYTYKYARPALTTDCVVFGWDGKGIKILLIQRKFAPFKGDWAFPGGFVNVGENLSDAAMRELREETGLGEMFLEQLYTFSEPDRDPREQVITVAFFALINIDGYSVPKGDSDAAKAAWFSLAQLPKLGFDHAQIYQVAITRLRAKIRYQPVGFELLPDKFSLTQLQSLYEAILQAPLDKRNFRKKLLSMDLLIELDEVEQGVARKAAKLYRFDRNKYQDLQANGFQFKL